MIELKIAKTFIAGFLLSTSIAIPAFAQDQENSPSSLPVSQWIKTFSGGPTGENY
ncbi:hypothetical protein [Paenibacillus xylanivorans]|uniref:hypothetical protein n=1 Tax=Paenibacillus xylanivorans TaxID=1705561 RepID=UPI000AFFC10B|nr:hypothetical protein [Paenibacillus xylanivorans]